MRTATPTNRTGRKLPRPAAGRTKRNEPEPDETKRAAPAEPNETNETKRIRPRRTKRNEGTQTKRNENTLPYRRNGEKGPNEMKNAEIVAAVRAVIDSAEKMRNAYFFTPPGSAGGRRSYEKYHSAPCVEWNEGGHEYSAEYTVTCSCANVYAFGTYTRDGKKTTLTAIRNSLRRLEANA